MRQLPPWGQDDLPEPLPFSLRNIFRTIGPGAILLAASIGGGEWLNGPTAAVKHGTGIFWIATSAIILQLLFNLEGIRYTLYTGEPIVTGIMRLRPGYRLWGNLYVLLTVTQLGVPALASGCANVVLAAWLWRIPTDGDTFPRQFCMYGVIALGVILLMSGKKIERTLEILSWGMIAYIFTFLVAINVFCVPVEHSVTTALGFVRFGYLPRDGEFDILMLATLAATAGAGGVGNMAISNWIRDKGFGMGGRVGAIGSAFSHEHSEPSHVGKVFPITGENLRRWSLWWKYVQVDQVWLWALGCFVGMYLNVNMATAIIPPDQAKTMEGIAAGAFQADYLQKHYWSGLWVLGLINGFWILFSTHLGNTDVLVRIVTDIIWTADGEACKRRGLHITKIYSWLLIAVTAFGAVAIQFGSAMKLFQFLGVMANVVLALGAVQILMVNRKLLPRELRPSLFRQGMLVVCAVVYAFVTAAVVYDQFRQWTAVKKPAEVQGADEARRITMPRLSVGPYDRLAAASIHSGSTNFWSSQRSDVSAA